MTRPEAPERARASCRRDAATRSRRRPGASTAAAGQAASPLPAPSLVVATAAATVGAPAVRAERAQSPYLALIRNRNFSLLWIGQLISFFGDRIHQVALGVLLIDLGTPLDLGIALAMTAAPNVLLGPLAGALVDRWDRRVTMIVCDVAARRAGAAGPGGGHDRDVDGLCRGLRGGHRRPPVPAGQDRGGAGHRATRTSWSPPTPPPASTRRLPTCIGYPDRGGHRGDAGRDHRRRLRAGRGHVPGVGAADLRHDGARRRTWCGCRSACAPSGTRWARAGATSPARRSCSGTR